MPLLAVPANDIDTAGVAIDAALPVSWLDQELGDSEVRGSAPGRVFARLSRSGKDVVVRGRVTAKLTMPCARCLDPAPVDVDTELSLLLKPRPGAKVAKAARAPKPDAPAKGKGARPGAPGAALGKAKGAHNRSRQDEYEFSTIEADVDTYDGETVVLDGFVREALLLETPNFPLCSDACPGIRPTGLGHRAGPAVGGIDPRLSPLGALRAKLLAGRPAEDLDHRAAVRPGQIRAGSEQPVESRSQAERELEWPSAHVEAEGEEPHAPSKPHQDKNPSPEDQEERRKDQAPLDPANQGATAVAVPKRKTTSSKSKMRRAQHDKVTPVQLVSCEQCGEAVLPHRACPACGHYKGRKVKATKTAG